jgi:hypothetical protein
MTTQLHLTARVSCAQLRAAVAPEHVPLPREVHHFQFRYPGALMHWACMESRRASLDQILSRDEWCLCVSQQAAQVV